MVNKSKLHLLDNATTVRLSETFKLLGDPTRIKILTILSNDEMCVCDIAATLQMGQSAISHQLRLLRGARLVKFRREGKEAWYSLDDNHVVVLLNQGLQHILHN
ncbi:ArsR/SmtB family transcription factor [Pectinatus frisingensis]|uniref:ArsR/SmtB family transcription factor n=1 Tax=Pectinatus frisingensis TaxID=865 RepID=UPI0039BF8FC6